MFWFVFLQLSTLAIRETCAKQSAAAFTEEVKNAIKTLSRLLLGPVSKNNIGDIQVTIDKTISDAEKQGRPIRFGIGVLHRSGMVVAGRYVVGTFIPRVLTTYEETIPSITKSGFDCDEYRESHHLIHSFELKIFDPTFQRSRRGREFEQPR